MFGGNVNGSIPSGFLDVRAGTLTDGLIFGVDTLNTPAFWLNTDRPPLDQTALRVGAGTRDTGFSLTRLTFQVTHATDPDANEE
jgi:hypothetical protein